MAVHILSDSNPLYVTGSDRYRIPFTGFLTPAHPQFAAMEEFFLPEHRRPEGYGLAFLESEEHSLTYLTSIRQIQEYRAANTDGTATLDPTQGFMYGFWPRDDGWDDYLPANTWHPGGEGIITEFPHPLGGKVTVFEYLKDGPDGEKTPMVGLHCEHCHPDPATDHENNFPNRGPQDRRWIARNARLHIRSHTEQCRPVDPRIAEVVTAVANKMHSTNNPVITQEARCATTGPCAQIRSLRARGLVAR
jgi:hypothetical protein